jgi:hypothetical protein
VVGLRGVFLVVSLPDDAPEWKALVVGTLLILTCLNRNASTDYSTRYWGIYRTSVLLLPFYQIFFASPFNVSRQLCPACRECQLLPLTHIYSKLSKPVGDSSARYPLVRAEVFLANAKEALSPFVFLVLCARSWVRIPYTFCLLTF